eukprot:XP_001699799.1 predicted protein [Chlamydomonas reinhardtii]
MVAEARLGMVMPCLTVPALHTLAVLSVREPLQTHTPETAALVVSHRLPFQAKTSGTHHPGQAPI